MVNLGNAGGLVQYREPCFWSWGGKPDLGLVDLLGSIQKNPINHHKSSTS